MSIAFVLLMRRHPSECRFAACCWLTIIFLIFDIALLTN